MLYGLPLTVDDVVLLSIDLMNLHSLWLFSGKNKTHSSAPKNFYNNFNKTYFHWCMLSNSNIYIRAPQPPGHSPLPGCGLFGTGPGDWLAGAQVQLNMQVADWCACAQVDFHKWRAGMHATQFAQAQASTYVCMAGHHLRSPVPFSPPSQATKQ